MNELTSPIADDLPMRESHHYVVEKLGHLQRYLDMVATSMRQKWPVRRYIDLFSGPGKCRDADTGAIVLGSPLIALGVEHPFTNYVFVDADETNIEALRSRAAGFQPSRQIDFYIGDCNELADSIVKKIRQSDAARKRRGGSPSLNIAFVDPEGLEVRWSTIEALASVDRMDLIIHYSDMGVTRNLDNCLKINGPTILDAYFGDDQWRRIYAENQASGKPFVHRALIDHYKQKLAGFGYVDVQDPVEPQIQNIKNRTLYRLVFASKHRRGTEFWSKVTAKDATGQRRLF